MKKFDIFGVGNALVDIEFRLATKKLERLDLPKGMMTLVSDSRQRELLGAVNLKSKEVQQSCGGSAANSLVTASILGSKTFLALEWPRTTSEIYFAKSSDWQKSRWQKLKVDR